MLHEFSKNTVDYLYQHLPAFDETQKPHMVYGLEILLTEWTKFILLFVAFAAMGQTRLFLAAFAIFCTYRISAGGFHFSTYWRCFWGTGCYFVLLIIGVKVLYNFVENQPLVATFVLIIFIGIGAILAPVPSIYHTVSRQALNVRRIVFVITNFIYAASSLITSNNRFLTLLVVSLGLYNIQLYAGGIRYDNKKESV